MSDESTENREDSVSEESKFSSTMRIEIPPDLLADVQRGPETSRFRVRQTTPKTSKIRPQETPSTKYDQLLQSIYDAAIITNLDGRILDSNARATEFFGFSARELQDLSILDIISGADISLLKTLCQNLKNEKFALLQAYCLRKSQSFFPAEIAVNSLKFEETLLCFFVRDVTLRRQAEEMLRTEHNAIQNAGNGIAIANEQAKLEYVNPAIVQLWGYEGADDLIGQDVRALLANSESVDGMIATVLQGHESWSGEMVARRINGEEFYAQVSVACNRDSDGEVVGMVLSFDDISDRKRAEEALRQSERQRVMLASVGAACHHLGQPATVIMTNLELIRRMTKDISKPELQEIIALTNEAADSLADVLHKLNAVNEYRTVQYLDTQSVESPANVILDI